MDPSDIVRASLDDGNSLDEIAHALISDHHLAPVPAIKAMRTGGNMTLGEAKEVVHRNLPIEQQEAAERLWDELINNAELMANDDPKSVQRDSP
jgi:hypothetical protein